MVPEKVKGTPNCKIIVTVVTVTILLQFEASPLTFSLMRGLNAVPADPQRSAAGLIASAQAKGQKGKIMKDYTFEFIEEIDRTGKFRFYLIESTNCWNLFITHIDYGTLEFIFGLPKDQTQYKEAIEIMLANINISVQDYKADYLDLLKDRDL